MEGPIAIEQKHEAAVEKQEMDQSFNNRMSDKEESGFHSSCSSQSGETDSSWLMLKGEIMDPTLFNPPIHHSSNLDVKGLDSAVLCNISTISGEEVQYKGNANYLIRLNML